MRFSHLYFPINFLFLTIGIFITLYNILNINLYKGNKKGRLLINQNKNYILKIFKKTKTITDYLDFRDPKIPSTASL